jgi:hypothetical protein
VIHRPFDQICISAHFSAFRTEIHHLFCCSRVLFLLAKLLSKDQQLPILTPEELQEMKNLYVAPELSPPANHNKIAMYRRLHELAEFAQHKRVRLMVDAEQTYAIPFPQFFSCDIQCSYLQPAIDHCVHRLQRSMNTAFPTIYNTFQCYLTDTPSRIALDLERARQGGCV